MKLCMWYGDLSVFDMDGWHYGDAGKARKVSNTRGSYLFRPDPRGKHLSDIYVNSITAVHSDDTHAHGKPLEWITLLIGDCTRGIVFDPYAGGGVSILACEQLKRCCLAIEIDPGYVGSILERFALMFPSVPIRQHIDATVPVAAA